MKDVTVTFPDGLGIAAICKRENPYDTLIIANIKDNLTAVDKKVKNILANLPQGAVIGTSSLRRRTQLLRLRPDMQIKNCRGNIQTRLTKLDNNEYDAIILAYAGMKRMQLNHRAHHIFSVDEMIPAVGQGAIVVECLRDSEIWQMLQLLNHTETAQCVWAERRVNELLNGGCQVPLAVHARLVDKTTIIIDAMVASIDGKEMIYSQQQGQIINAIKLAETVTEDLLRQGAARLLSNGAH